MEEKGIVKYKARDGQELQLSANIIKKYLVQGNREAVTDQEIMYFLGICKSRGLNPFIRDAYIIKYGTDPAAIVTSIDYFRARARAQKDCKGWKAGVIVQKEDGTLRYSAGLVLNGETIVGGFFEGKPDNWTEPVRLEVNLGGYIKKTKDGKITRFWQPENQPTMIAKVAESQGLRRLWPDEFQGLYEESEIRPSTSPPIDILPEGHGPVTNGGPEAFEAALGDRLKDPLMQQFIKLALDHTKMPMDEFKAQAAEDIAGFLAQFEKWNKAQDAAAKSKKEVEAKQPKKPQGKTTKAPDPKPEESKAETSPENAGESTGEPEIVDPGAPGEAGIPDGSDSFQDLLPEDGPGAEIGDDEKALAQLAEMKDAYPRLYFRVVKADKNPTPENARKYLAELEKQLSSEKM